MFKAAISQFLAQQLRYHPNEQAMMCALLSEVGRLAIISALNAVDDDPDAATFLKLCEAYARPLTLRLLQQWNIDETLMTAISLQDNWHEVTGENFELADLLNLAHFRPYSSCRPPTVLGHHRHLYLLWPLFCRKWW